MKEVNIKTGFSQNRNEVKAIDEVFEQIRQENIKLVIMFADAGYNQLKINEAWREKIPQNTSFIGCSSLRLNLPFIRMTKNITHQGFKDGITAMSISSEKMNFSVKLMKNIKESWKEQSSQALIEAAKDLNLDLKNANPEKYFVLLLTDFFSAKEDYILENLYKMSGLLFVGGGAGGKFNPMVKGNATPGYIHTKEGAFTNSAAIALVRCDIPFKIDLVTSLVPTEIKFKITKGEGRFIYELDGKPAFDKYIKALGVPRIAMGIEKIPNYRLLMAYPLGLMIGDRAYVRSIATFKGKSLMMAANIKEGQVLHLMRRSNIVEVTREKVTGLKQKLGSISGLILFNCCYRLLESEMLGVSENLFKIINIAPLIGLNSYGEYYGWISMTHTLTILAIGNSSN
ncbi:hypothetical protein AMJ49_00415 [Parcubacteria bacterium DG_74_2]|nr:MAG: hypothetical protein AMJ49_00415 [Parcubacteria bacterium DG_74_2]